MTSDLKRQYQRDLGDDEFGAIYYEVVTAWARAVARLNDYRALFDDQANIDFLNTISGGAFMGDVQRSLWRDLLLYITRLTDRGTRNLTVRGLLRFCDDPELSARVKSLVDAAVEAARFARLWRDKIISHSDLSLVTDPHATPLEPVTFAQAEKALDAVHAVLDAISWSIMRIRIVNRVTPLVPGPVFLNSAQQLVAAVRFVDSLMDPTGTVPFNSFELAENFLVKLGCEPTTDRITELICLRQAASRFS